MLSLPEKRSKNWFVLLLLTSLFTSVVTFLCISNGQSFRVYSANNTVVSLEFDDGSISHLTAQTILEAHGMKGVFYINSKRIGKPGFLNLSQLISLQANGHEIGGHTLNHVNLATLSVSAQRTEIIDDYNLLLSQGLNITSFAYPFGSYNSDSISILKEVGYKSARTVGGIGCNGCRFSESIPPLNPFVVETPSSVKSTTTLLWLQNTVTKVEQNGGGWIRLVMHHVDTSGDNYSITPSNLATFLDWLQPRSSQGTIVKTVTEVMLPISTPTPTITVVLTPTPTPTVDPSLNLLTNPSLEFDTDFNSIPDAWELISYGTSTYSSQRVSDAHTGVWSHEITLLTTNGGDRKFVSTMKDLTKAPSAIVGKKYTVSASYKSNNFVRFVAYYRTSAGKWVWLSESSNMLASSLAWKDTSWTTPAIPTGATHISVGMMIKTVGWFIIDDISLN